MSLSGKNIILTGATSGFGVSIADLLSREGASVFIGGRRADRGAKVAAETNTTFHAVDVADTESSKSFFAAAEKHFGGPESVDYILLNAGVEGNSEDTLATNLSIETFDYIYSVNVRGVIIGIKYGTPLLRKGGTFVTTSSVASILPMGANPIYASSKSAVDALVRSYANQFEESEDERIKSLSIVAVNPTVYVTEMSQRFVGGEEANEKVAAIDGFAKVVNPSQRPGTAEELAVIVRDYMQGELPYKSGETFAADADTHFPLNEYMDRMSNVVEQSA